MSTVRILQVAVALGLTVPLAAASRAPDTKPLPGYWETTNKATLSKTKVERRCLVASEIDKFLNNPSNRHYTCTYPHRAVGGGNIKLTGTCATKDGQVANVVATGTYSPTRFHMDLDIDTKIVGLPVSGSGSTDAVRLGDECPADAKRSDEAKARGRR